MPTPVRNPVLRALEGAGALALLAFFFAPWIRILGAPIAGHELHGHLGKARDILSVFGDNPSLDLDYSISRLLFLLPLCAVGVAVHAALAGSWRLPSLLAGILCAASAFYVMHAVRDIPFQQVAYGCYGTLALAPLFLFAAWWRGREGNTV